MCGIVPNLLLLYFLRTTSVRGFQPAEIRGGCSMSEKEWSGRLDLNQRPHAPQACALPGCATSRPRQPLCGCSDMDRFAVTRDNGSRLSPLFEKRQESAQRVAQIEQHFPAEELRRALARIMLGSAVVFAKMAARAGNRESLVVKQPFDFENRLDILAAV